MASKFPFFSLPRQGEYLLQFHGTVLPAGRLTSHYRFGSLIFLPITVSLGVATFVVGSYFPPMNSVSKTCGRENNESTHQAWIQA